MSDNILTEGAHQAEYIVQEAGPRALCREVVEVAGSETLQPGAVLGRVVTTASASVVADTGNTGDAVLSGVTVTLDDDVLEGDYILECTATDSDAGTFSVTAPDGTELDDLTVGSAYTTTHISLTLPDGDTDWAEGDIVTVEVTASSEQFKEYNPNATDGSQTAARILFRKASPEAGTPVQALVTSRLTVVDSKKLVWSDSVTPFNKKAALASLAARNIIALD